LISPHPGEPVGMNVSSLDITSPRRTSGDGCFQSYVSYSKNEGWIILEGRKLQSWAPIGSFV